MIKDRILDVIKSAAEVNLRYSAITLKLAKEYIKEFDGAVRSGVAGQPDPDETRPPPVRRPPILLVGQAGTQASGAFVLNNTAETELHVGLVVQGELGPAKMELLPASFVVAPADSAVVQIKVMITEAMEAGRDYVGAVMAPGLSAPPIDFVVRRLPGEAASSAPQAEVPPNTATG